MQQNLSESISLLDILEENVAFEFSGRINLLDQKASIIIGTIILREGLIIFSSMKDKIGIKAIIHILENHLKEDGDIRFTIEPEDVEAIIPNIEISKNTLNEIKKILPIIERNKKLRPANNLVIVINPEFIWKGEILNPKEFDLLTVITDNSIVHEIYSNSKFLEYEITELLISLRQKKALKVI